MLCITPGALKMSLVLLGVLLRGQFPPDSYMYLHVCTLNDCGSCGMQLYIDIFWDSLCSYV